MAINYFQELGLNSYNPAQALSQGQAYKMNKFNLDTAKAQEAERIAMNQQKEQAAQIKFANDQQKARAAQGAGAFYNALNSGNKQAALVIAQQYQDEINGLGDPSFTVDSVSELLQTPEGTEQLKQMSLGMVQMAGGPEQFAKFTESQLPSQQNQPEATAQIKNTAEYRRYTQAMNDAAKSGDIELAKQIKAERDFFVNQVDPFARSYAGGQGAGAARIETEQGLNPVLAERTAAQTAAQEGTATGQAELAKAQSEAEKAKQATADAEKIKARKIDLSRQTAKLAREIAGSENLDRVTGVGTLTPTLLPESQDLILKAEQLLSLLTAENLSLMSGVLTDKDIQMLQTLSSGMRVTDKGIRGSAPAIKKRLTEIATSIEKQLGGQSAAKEVIAEGVMVDDGRDDAAILAEYGVN